MILILLCADMVLITELPRLPQPTIPIVTAELLLVAKTIDGFRMSTPEAAPAAFKKFLRFIMISFALDKMYATKLLIKFPLKEIFRNYVQQLRFIRKKPE